MRASITLNNAQQGHKEYAALWTTLKAWLVSGKRAHCTCKTDTRSLAQNNLMWSSLGDLSKQVEWFGRRLTEKEWKDFISAHIDGQEIVPNMDGTGFVTLGRGKSTSEMTIAEMTEVIDQCHAFGTLCGVRWSRTSLGRDVPDEACA